jgi:hypothetical protein
LFEAVAGGLTGATGVRTIRAMGVRLGVLLLVVVISSGCAGGGGGDDAAFVETRAPAGQAPELIPGGEAGEPVAPRGVSLQVELRDGAGDVRGRATLRPAARKSTVLELELPGGESVWWGAALRPGTCTKPAHGRPFSFFLRSARVDRPFAQLTRTRWALDVYPDAGARPSLCAAHAGPQALPAPTAVVAEAGAGRVRDDEHIVVELRSRKTGAVAGRAVVSRDPETYRAIVRVVHSRAGMVAPSARLRPGTCSVLAAARNLPLEIGLVGRSSASAPVRGVSVTSLDIPFRRFLEQAYAIEVDRDGHGADVYSCGNVLPLPPEERRG